ncbi:hypothetical protein [Streptomyces sp. PH10-H1]|uniref:hypothetical protein n=1 Tax=Streptomyces sp. PH10-H1 TaxID=3046212 RepID=UPI0024B9CCFC|nr:hypothetical protein [Streptomyces sp. PH10-H1]MDJ0347252.1 hypothetical protein [Streptomyces sp. PH10-H1]
MTGQAVSKPRRGASEQTHLAIDWVAGHGNVSAPVAMATTAAATASLGAWTGLPGAWPLVVGAVGAATHGVGLGIRRRLSRPSLAVRAAAWLTASGWTSTVIMSDPTTWEASNWWAAVGSLAAIAVGAGAGLARADVHEEAIDESRRAMQAAMAEAEVAREDWAIVDQWINMIQVVARVDVTPAGFDRRKNGTGFALEVSLPIGYTADRFQAYATALAEAARLPVGCLVNISRARKQGHIVIDVDTEDPSTKAIPYPDGYAPLSVLSGIPWGLNRIGEELVVHMREACALILGPPGTGKTTLLDAVLTGFARCTDTIVFGIDVGKKGDAFVPWLMPWMEGQGLASPLPNTARLPKETRPGVDWVAATLDEADVMLDALIGIAENRLTEYRELMRQQDTKLLPVSAKIPMIFCVVDEGAEMLAYQGMDPLKKRVKAKLVSVMRTTRAMGIRLILTATDGNISSLGDSAVRKYSPVRIALTCTDPEGAGAAKLFGQVRGLDARQLRAKGSGVIGASTDFGFTPQPFRTWVTAPSLARDACLATEQTRPVLDEPSARAAGDVYRERWAPERIAWLTGGIPAAPASAGPNRPGVTTDLRSRLRIKGQETPAATTNDQEEAVAKFLAELGKLPEVDEPERDGKPRRQFKGLEGLRIRGQETPPADDRQEPEQDFADAGSDWKQAALRIIRNTGANVWLSTSAIRAQMEADGIQVNRSALSTWLGDMVRRGEINRRGTGPQTEYGAHGE